MKAACYRQFGPANEVLECDEIETPQPGPGEVGVRIAVSGINPVDVKRRRGGRGDMPAPLVIPHFDGAGIIDAVGDGVERQRIGQRVWIYEANWQRTLGTAAEFICLDADLAVPLDDDTSFDEGACLGIPALTAHACAFSDGDLTGQTVLVTGGTGGVGGYAVQFAKLAGAKVIATVGDDAKKERATRYGANTVINYRLENVAERVLESTDGAGVDRIIEVEFGGNLETNLQVVKTNGVIAAYASDAVLEPNLPFYRLVYSNLTVRHVLVFLTPPAATKKALKDISGWMRSKKLIHPQVIKMPLDSIKAAHELVEQGGAGKVLLNVLGD
jgi:NADPH:quinone reductase